jgi:hypothetical protein
MPATSDASAVIEAWLAICAMIEQQKGKAA